MFKSITWWPSGGKPVKAGEKPDPWGEPRISSGCSPVRELANQTLLWAGPAAWWLGPRATRNQGPSEECRRQSPLPSKGLKPLPENAWYWDGLDEKFCQTTSQRPTAPLAWCEDIALMPCPGTARHTLNSDAPHMYTQVSTGEEDAEGTQAYPYLCELVTAPGKNWQSLERGKWNKAWINGGGGWGEREANNLL